MNIITDTSRAYHIPCEIQSVGIDFSFTAWLIVAVVVVISVVAVAVVVAVAEVVVVVVVVT